MPHTVNYNLEQCNAQDDAEPQPLTPSARVQQAAQGLDRGQADRVTLKGVLGKGTYGVVYEGEWRGLGVAVKTGALGEFH